MGRGRAEFGQRFERGKPVGKLADDLLQRALLDFEVALRGDFLAGGKVETRLRLVRVGDGGGAHLEVALRLRQLLRDGRLLRLDESQAVLGREHVEIRLGHAHDQVLRGLPENRFGLGHLEAGFLIQNDALPVEQGLRQRHAVAVGVAFALRRRRRVTEIDVDVVHLGVRAGTYRRQQQRQPLRQAFAPRVARGPRRGICRVIGTRLAVGLQQIRRGERLAERKYGEENRVSFHVGLNIGASRVRPGRPRHSPRPGGCTDWKSRCAPETGLPENCAPRDGR